MGQNGDVGIQLAVERNGGIVQHNDVVDDPWHAGGTRNNRSVGVEIVSEYTSGESSGGGNSNDGNSGGGA
jgi:N-acetyl-anhydromuramyl-L-alanine amidase AmpD